MLSQVPTLHFLITVDCEILSFQFANEQERVVVLSLSRVSLMEGFRSSLVGGHDFHLPFHFTNLELIGSGGHSVVCSALDTLSNQRVAIKKLSLRCSRAALREITILKRLRHQNVVCVHEVVSYGDLDEENLNSVYVVQELMPTDLGHLFKRSTMDEDHVKIFLYYLLKGVKYIHSANVIHRDIKPSNVLIDGETLDLKICDFGLARVLDSAYYHGGFLTETVCTQWYRAPEVMLTPKDYTNKIDMWSVGCVFAEMLLGGKPLFPGSNEYDQIRLILQTVRLDSRDLEYLRHKGVDSPILPRQPREIVALPQNLQTARSEALDLLDKMLTFNPETRISAEQALSHPYLKEFANPDNEPVASDPFYIESEVNDYQPENTMKEMIRQLSCSSPRGLELLIDKQNVKSD